MANSRGADVVAVVLTVRDNAVESLTKERAD